MTKECMQMICGPTPCFREVNMRVCSLDYCTAERVLEEGLVGSHWEAINGYCVMGDEYGCQRRFNEGRGEYIRLISE